MDNFCDFELFFQQCSIVSMGVYAFWPPHFAALFLLTLKISKLCFVARGKPLAPDPFVRVQESIYGHGIYPSLRKYVTHLCCVLEIITKRLRLKLPLSRQLHQTSFSISTAKWRKSSVSQQYKRCWKKNIHFAMFQSTAGQNVNFRFVRFFGP